MPSPRRFRASWLEQGSSELEGKEPGKRNHRLTAQPWGVVASFDGFSWSRSMGMKLYVGTCPTTCRTGTSTSCSRRTGRCGRQVIMDRDTGRSKGFGFVEMSSEQEAQAAIQGLHGKEVEGRTLTVNGARPKEERPRGGGFGGGGGGGYGGGGGGGRRGGGGGGGYGDRGGGGGRRY